jgi:hypothetical protein
MEAEAQEKAEKESSTVQRCVGLGVICGVLFGLATDNMGLGIGVGVSLGAAVGYWLKGD